MTSGRGKQHLIRCFGSSLSLLSLLLWLTMKPHMFSDTIKTVILLMRQTLGGTQQQMSRLSHWWLLFFLIQFPEPVKNFFTAVQSFFFLLLVKPIHLYFYFSYFYALFLFSRLAFTAHSVLWHEYSITSNNNSLMRWHNPITDENNKINWLWWLRNSITSPVAVHVCGGCISGKVTFPSTLLPDFIDIFDAVGSKVTFLSFDFLSASL